jgi:hypothetical protein
MATDGWVWTSHHAIRASQYSWCKLLEFLGRVNKKTPDATNWEALDYSIIGNGSRYQEVTCHGCLLLFFFFVGRAEIKLLNHRDRVLHDAICVVNVITYNISTYDCQSARNRATGHLRPPKDAKPRDAICVVRQALLL